MRRRLFFRSLIGAHAVVSAELTTADPSAPILAKGHIPACECGYQFMIHRLYSDSGATLGECMHCSNPQCRNHSRQFELPTVIITPVRR